MARPNPELIAAIERTISKLQQGASYQWGHMGACNCGNLAQELTYLSKAEIHRFAMQRHGDWNEQLFDYCPTSGLPIDHIIDEMIAFGFTKQDLGHLEKLSDPKILQNLPLERRNLKHNMKADVILYLKTWADYLENQLIEKISIQDVLTAKVLS